jgi:hypothetical protein
MPPFLCRNDKKNKRRRKNLFVFVTRIGSATVWSMTIAVLQLTQRRRGCYGDDVDDDSNDTMVMFSTLVM